MTLLVAVWRRVLRNDISHLRVFLRLVFNFDLRKCILDCMHVKLVCNQCNFNTILKFAYRLNACLSFQYWT